MLELRNLGIAVPTEDGKTKHILDDVSFTINDGEVVVITGPNGSGKSTLAKAVMGLMQPTSGQILLDGQDITHATIDQRANLGVSFAFQQPVRFKGLKVEDLLRIASGRELSLREACDYLVEVGMCANDYVGRELNDSLSGGEMKRIEIAMLLARGTRLSIFDEPEAGIDLWSFQNLIEVFEEMQERNSGSILIISHQERILEIADRIVVISDGTILEQGTREEMMPKLSIPGGLCEYKKG